MQKKGQVTIFIILGLLIVIFVGLFFIFTSIDFGEYDTEKQAAAHALIEQCVEDVATKGIRFLSAKGGYYYIPPEFVVYALEDNPIQSHYPYYYKDHELLVPDISELEEQFSLYLLANLRVCYGNTTYALESTGEDRAEVIISEDSLEIIYDPKMMLVEEKSRTTIDDINVVIPSTYYQAYTAAVALAAEQNTDDNTFCLSCLRKYETKSIIENIITQEIALEPYYVILYGINYTEQARGEQILFMFAGRYEITPRPTELSLAAIPDQSISIGYSFSYQVKATGSQVMFADNSDLFDIDPETGLISFYPDETMLGTHLIEIIAADASENQDSALFYLTITGVNEAPELNYIGYVQATAGQEFTYNVTQTGNQTLYYTDDTDLFDIGLMSGKILFTPTEAEQGTYTITITAINDKGGSSNELMYLIIT